jgi:hypothetical protein
MVGLMSTQRMHQLVDMVANLKRDLAAAQNELSQLVAGIGNGEPSPSVRTARSAKPLASKPPAPSDGKPVAERVREMLKKAKESGASFGGLVAKAQSQPGTVKSALKKDREKGLVVFDNGVYFWAEFAPKKAPKKLPAKVPVTFGKPQTKKPRQASAGQGGSNAAPVSAEQSNG